MVKITQIVCRVRYHRRIKDVFERKGIYKINCRPSMATQIVTEKGHKIHNPLKFVNPPPKKWVPEKNELLPNFLNAPLLESIAKQEEKDMTEYKQVWHLSDRCTFTEGIDQACMLTKAQRFDGLPPQIEQLIDKYQVEGQDERIHELIRHCQQWENSKDKLPKRKDMENLSWVFRREFGILDSKAATYLIHDLLRLAQGVSERIPDLVTQRRVMSKPELQTQYQYKGETINISAMSELMVFGRQYLPAPGNKPLIQESVNHTLLDMYPISPTIDLEQRLTKQTGDHPGLQHMSGVPCSFPQLLLRRNNHLQEGSNQAFNMMLTFATALTEARVRYGVTSGPLDNPITILNMNATYNNINFLVFQLNTLDLDSEDGVKNLVWVDTENKLFKRVKCQPWKNKNRRYMPDEYQDYDADVFKKYLAMYLYGYAT